MKSGKIYKVYCIRQDQFHIGCTFDDLHKRMIKLIREYLAYKQGNRGYSRVFDIYDLYGYQNCVIQLIKEFKDITPEDLALERQKYIERLKTKRTRNIKEYMRNYYDNHLAEKKLYDKEYYLKHKERIRNQKKELIMCVVCNREIQLAGINKHMNTKTHLNNLETYPLA